MKKYYRFLPITLFGSLLTPLAAHANATMKNSDSFLSGLGFNSLQSYFTEGTGQIVVIVLFFVLVIFFLRMLFGPKGKLRDPRWDELNKESRAADAKQRASHEAEIATRRREEFLKPIIVKETACFLEYADEFIQADPAHASMLHLKREHTLRVLENAWRIVENEADFALFTKVIRQDKSALTRFKNLFRTDESIRPDRILLFAALYHDLGRFEQLKQYGTFRDADSFNHAALGAKLLHNSRFMQQEKPETQALVRTAVLVHNRAHFPKFISPALQAPVKALMDADKIDILRIMHAELTSDHLPDKTVMLGLSEDGPCSPAILDAVEQGRCALYADMHTQNDFRMLLGSWFLTLFYETSRHIVIQEGTLRDIIAQLPEEARTGQARKALLEKLS